MKSYTDLEQSRTLAKFLPHETADMKWFVPADNEGEFIEEVTFINSKSEYHLFDKVTDWNDTPYVPCWSLVALLDILPYPQLSKDKLGSGKEGWMVSAYPDNCRYDSCWYDNPIDACVDMIIKLHNNNLL